MYLLDDFNRNNTPGAYGIVEGDWDRKLDSIRLLGTLSDRYRNSVGRDGVPALARISEWASLVRDIQRPWSGRCFVSFWDDRPVAGRCELVFSKANLGLPPLDRDFVEAARTYRTDPLSEPPSKRPRTGSV